MEIEIQARGFAVTAALRSYVSQRLGRALAPYRTQVRRVVARLGDENGPRGGNDKCCSVGISVGHAPDVFVTDKRSDLYLAIDRAAARLVNAVSRRLQRKRQSRRARAAQIGFRGGHKSDALNVSRAGLVFDSREF